MYEKQHTLKSEVSFEGVGLHTGEISRIIFKPAPENHGFVYKRMDLPDQPLVPANIDYVTEQERGTTLGIGDVKIHTVEHSLAALAGLQIDNVLMEIYGSEVPILDGSAIEFVKGFKAVGIEEQKANREFYVIDEPVHYNDPVKQIDIAAFPFDGYRITVMVDYNSNVLGIQHATLVQIENFETEFASSRTFCFFHELEGLLQAGLIKGGDLNNAIVIVDKVPSQEQLEQLAKLFNKKDVQVKEGYLNNIELRHKNEPARHKLLDMVGDLSLLGNPIKAQILAARPGHAANIAFAKNLKKLIKQKKLIKKYQKNASQNVVFDINAIQKILPHRYPFLLVDKIIEFRENYIVGVKNVTINEPFFVGHFEGNPIMPGVLQLEAMAQVGGVLLLNSVENPNDVWVYFLAIDNARFRKPVVPGDQLVFKLELIALKRGICKMSGKAFVNDVLVSEADLTASLVPKKKNESE
jgi:UDP-3-O-[3-hydroxymyristoyl] N-acetylglucosamine deacetylase/3-hydroxyacyl-[acyl-carrier-protein] dehydratase